MLKLLISLFLFMTTYVISETNTEATKQPIMSLTDSITGKEYKIEGTTVGLKIKGIENKVVFLEFFGHRCPPCLASIPHLINLQKKYKEKLVIMAVEVQGYDNKQLKAFAKTKKMNYIVASSNSAREFVDYIQQRAQWKGSIPFLVALDTKGAVQFVQPGMIQESTLDELITKLSTQTPKTSKKPEIKK